MIPLRFPEANTLFGPPEGLAESQVMPIPAYTGKIAGGSMDGSSVVVVAWQPTAEELALLNAGQPLFLSFIGGLPPHFPCLSFQEATHPA